MKTYFGYIRVSTAKQGEQGVSLQEQRAAIVNYSQRHSLAISDWFEEIETAAKRGRPVFTSMMSLLRKNKADGVIIHKIDRSARNLKDWADLGELIDTGIEVHFANENLDLYSRGGRLSADIQAVVASDYIRNLREETRKGFYGRIKQGLYPLPAPVGYIDLGKGKPKEPDPVKAPLVKKTFELYATGRYTLKSLSQEMYGLGLRNRNGNKITRNGYSTMLNNPFYMGLIKLKSTGETFPGSHKPLINKSLFDRIQRILSGKCGAKVIKYDFLFRRMIKCQDCGYSLIGEKQKGHVYYRCQTKGCPTKGFREEMIEDGVLNTLSKIGFDEKEKSYFEGQILQLRENWAVNQSEQTNSLELRLNQINDRLNRLTDAYIDRLIEKDIFEQRKEALLMEKKELEDKLAEIKANKTSMPEKLSNFLELAEAAYSGYKMGIPEEKRDLLKSVTSNRSVSGKNIEISLQLPFNLIANRVEFANGGQYRDKPRNIMDNLFEELVQWFTLNNLDYSHIPNFGKELHETD